MIATSDDPLKWIPPLVGLECWYVSTGGAAKSTFELALGEKVLRPHPLRNTAHSEAFRQFEGSVSILVWCAWRLDGSHGPLTSWDDTEQSIKERLRSLVGARIEHVDIVPNSWDISIRFSNQSCLRVFCDHVPGDPSFDGNWDLSTQTVSIAFGPGANYRIENCSSVKAVSGENPPEPGIGLES
jgi:hypothetical protein